MDGIIQFYAPLTMEGQFQELYCTFCDMHRTSASAFVQGGRGMGKSLLVSAVLRALTKNELRQSHNRPAFWRVHVHGIATHGHSVETVVREILQQLSDIATEASSSTWEEDEAKSS
jgi:predicted ATPase